MAMRFAHSFTYADDTRAIRGLGFESGHIGSESLGERGEDPADVAKAAVFFASEDAAYVTGVVLPVDGGYRRSERSDRMCRQGGSI